MNSVAPHPAAAERSPVSPGDRKLWRVIQRVAGLLLVAVGLIMCFDYLQARREDPLESPKLKALKEDLRATPTSEPLKQQIRELDLKLRESYFRHITRMASGVWLILGAGAVWLFATSRSRPKAHAFDFLRTRPAVSDNPREKSVALWAVGLTGAATAVFLAWLSVGAQRSTLPIHIAEVDALLGGSPDAAAAPDCASDADLERNWARFRGPGGNGVALSGKAPTSWNAESDAGIAWKVPSPVAGYNSPIIFGNSIYFSGGEASKLEVVCLRSNDGQLVWRQTVEPPPGSGETGEVPESTGYAPSTMATDGRRVYAMFANGVLAALTMDGKPVWSKSCGATHPDG